MRLSKGAQYNKYCESYTAPPSRDVKSFLSVLYLLGTVEEWGRYIPPSFARMDRPGGLSYSRYTSLSICQP
jgi:hypothetical protein